MVQTDSGIPASKMMPLAEISHRREGLNRYLEDLLCGRNGGEFWPRTGSLTQKREDIWWWRRVSYKWSRDLPGASSFPFRQVWRSEGHRELCPFCIVLRGRNLILVKEQKRRQVPTGEEDRWVVTVLVFPSLSVAGGQVDFKSSPQKSIHPGVLRSRCPNKRQWRTAPWALTSPGPKLTAWSFRVWGGCSGWWEKGGGPGLFCTSVMNLSIELGTYSFGVDKETLTGVSFSLFTL